jgi:hypothetical protein
MEKRRYTIDEIYEMKRQIFDDNQAERAKFSQIAEWVSGKARYKCKVQFSDFAVGLENPHIPFYYISVPMNQYDIASPWIVDGVNGPNKCKPPVAGIHIRTEGFMLDAEIPDIGKVNVYVAVENYDAHSAGW